MAAPIVLGITIRADGSAQVRRDLQGTRDDLNNVGRAAQQSNRQFADMARETLGLGSVLKGLAGIAAAAMGGFSLAKASQEIGSFESKMINVKALTMANAVEMAAMQNQARELGATTSFSAQQAAEAQGVLASAGLKTNEILSATPQVLNLAAAGSLDLARAAEIATGTMKGLGLSLSDLPHINDVLAKTAADTSTNVGEIGAAMQNIAPLAQSFGISIEDISASIGILANNQIKGAEAGNNMKAMLVALGSETKDKTEILSRHGLAFSDLNVQTKGYLPVLEALRKANLSGAEALTLFGSDAAAASLILTRSASEVDKLSEALKKSKGAADAVAAILNSGLEKELDALLGTVSEGILQLGDAGLKGALSGIITTTTGVISIYEGLGDKYAESNKLTKEQYQHLNEIASGLVNVGKASLIAASGITAFIVTQNLLTASVGLSARALAALRATMLAVAAVNPFTWVITAIAAAGSALYLYRDTLMTVGESTATIGEVMESVWLTTRNAAVDTLDEINIKFPELSSTVGTAAGFIGDVFANAWRMVKDLAALAVDGVVGLFVGLGSALGVAAGGIVEVFSQSFEKIKGMAGGLGLGIEAALAGDLSFTDFKTALNTQVKGFSDVGKEMGSAFVDGFNESQGTFTKMAGAFDGYEKKVSEGANALHALNTMVAANAAAADGSAQAVAELAHTTGGAAKVAGELAKATGQSAEATKKAATETKKAADVEKNRREEVQKTITGLQFELEVNRLSDNEKKLQTELRQNLAKAVGDERIQIDSLVRQIDQEAQARQRQQAMWDESIRQANELYDLQHDASDTQRLADMAKTLHLMGATNEEISQRVNLEKQLSDAVKAHPDQDPQVVRDSIIAKQRASDEIAKYTDTNTSKSAAWMEAAFKKASENIQDSFGDMFENMLNGDAMASIDKFADNIRKTLNQAISQQLALDLQNLFTGKGGLGDMFKSAMLFGVSMLAWLQKKPDARTYAPSEIGNSPVMGVGAMHIADSFSRDRGYEFQSQAAIAFNKSLDYLTGTIMGQVGKITDWVSMIGSKLASFSVVAQVADFFKPVTSVISQGLNSITTLYSSVSNFISTGITAVTNFVGLTTAAATSFINSAAAWSAGIKAGAGTFAGGVQAAEAAAGSAAGSGADSSGGSLANVGYALAVIKFGYDMFTVWSNDNATLHTKITNSLYAASDAALSVAATMLASSNFIGALGAVIVAGVLNLSGVVSDVIEQGKLTREALGRLLFGPFGGMFLPPRTPNAWMNNYNPRQEGQPFEYNPSEGTYTHTGNKDAHIGEQTAFGMLVISTHEASMSVDEMKNAFGPLLKTVKTIDQSLLDTINSVDKTGKTMEYYNNLLRSFNGNEVGVKTKQDLGDLNVAGMLTEKYRWVIDRLAESGTETGKAIKLWFDVISSKLTEVSSESQAYVLGTVNMIAQTLPDLMNVPLSVIELIGRSVKSITTGTLPAQGFSQLIGEILTVISNVNFLETKLKELGMSGDEGAVIDALAKFLTSINAIGFGVEEASINLLAYGIAMKNSGKGYTDAVAFIDAANAKFASLKAQGLDNTQVNAYFGSFGLMANLFAEAGVNFKESDLDNAAKHLHDTAKASVEVAKNTIAHAIATEKLNNVTKEAAIATLVKSGKLDEAVVAEAEYGVSLQGLSKDLYAQMGFIQQLGFITGKTLGSMGVSAETWANAAKNVVNVFRDMEKAMSWLDTVAKNFLSPKDYAQYNLDTVNRSIYNMQDSNPALKGVSSADIAKAVKSGTDMNAFINMLATGTGEAAAAVKQYIDLLVQQKNAQEALTASTAVYTDNFNAILKKRLNIIDQIGVLTNDPTLKEQQRQRALTDLKSKDLSVQLAAIDTLQSLVMDNYAKQLDMVKAIRGYVQDLKIGDLSPLSSKDKLDEAKKQAYATYDKVKGGNLGEVSNLTKQSDTYLKLARDYYGGSAEYAKIFNEVTGALDGLSGGSGVSIENQQLDMQSKAVDQLKVIAGYLDSIWSQHGEGIVPGVLPSVDFSLGLSAALKKLTDSLEAYVSDNVIKDQTRSTLMQIMWDFTTAIEQYVTKGVISESSGTELQQAVLGLTQSLLTAIGKGYITDADMLGVTQQNMAFIDSVKNALVASTITQDQAGVIVSARLITQQSIVTALNAGYINTTTAAYFASEVNRISGSWLAAIATGTVSDKTMSQLTTDTSNLQALLKSITGSMTQLVDNLNNSLKLQGLSASDLAAIKQGFTSLSDDLQADLISATLSSANKEVIAQGYADLSGNLYGILSNAKLSSVDIANVSSGFTRLGDVLHTAIAKFNLSPTDIAMINQGMTALSGNAKNVLAARTMSPEDIGFISYGFSMAASNVKTDIASLALSDSQKDLLRTGMGMFAAGVQSDIAAEKIGQSQLDMVKDGVNTLAGNMKTGLSSVEWLVEPGATVIAGVNTLAGHIKDGLGGIAIDNTQVNTAVNALMSAVAAQITAAQTQASSIIAAAQASVTTSSDALTVPSGLDSSGAIATVQAFANGGAFTNSIVTRPTAFNVMGEAGPEAVMPLTNVNGSLGVRVIQSGGDDKETAEQLREVVKELRTQNEHLIIMINDLRAGFGQNNKDNQKQAESLDTVERKIRMES